MNRLLLIFYVFVLTVPVINGQNKNANYKVNEALEIKLDSTIEDLKQLKIQLDNSTFISSKKNEQIQNKIQNQNILLTEIKQQIEKPNRSVFSEFVYPIFLSIIAAVIFWFAFSFIPERSRKLKIRGKIDLEIYQVYTRLFALFDLIMRKNNHSPSDYQQLIRGKKLSKRDIEIGLQNKCLNESYMFYPELRDNLLPIGKNLWKYENKINGIIDRLFNFSFYLNPVEILLFENIRNKLNTYELEDYNRDAFAEIGGMKLHPVNPSISYMTNNFNELFDLFSQLQDLVFSNKLETRDIYISKIQYLFYSEQYVDTIKTIKKGQNKYEKDKNFMNAYIFQSLYKIGRKSEAYKIIESLFETKLHLVSNRNSLKDYLEDEKIKELINKYFSNSEITELETVIVQERLIENQFIANAKFLENFYTQKQEQNSKKK